MQYSLEPLNITKELILSKVSEENIFEHYGVPVKKGLFCSILRNDRNPTVALYRNKKGRLMMKDFGDGSCLDCFGLVEAKFGVSYYMALQIIANDFGLITRPNLIKNKPKIQYTDTKIETSQSKIQVEIRDFDDKDIRWWNQYGISKDTLDKFKVYSCKNVWLNGNLFYLFSETQRVYGYYGGIKDNLECWRCYFPGKRKYKFIGNWKSLMIQGAHMLPKQGGDYIVITKSMKDVMCLYEYGIPAIAPCSENVFITDSQLERIKKKFKRIYLLYDNDETGLSFSFKIKRQHPEVKLLYLPRYGGDKDISDFRKAHGYKKTLELINKVKNYYGETS